MGEGIGIARAVAAELEAAKFDPLFVNAVAKNVDKCLELFLGRIDGLVSSLMIFLIRITYSLTDPDFS